MNSKNKTKKLRALLAGTALIAAFSMALALSSCKGDEPSSTTTDGNTTGPAQTTSGPEIIHPVKFDESTADITLYNNPIVSVQKTTWQNYGTGDPFVMRYDGKYYLYNSTKELIEELGRDRQHQGLGNRYQVLVIHRPCKLELRGQMR